MTTDLLLQHVRYARSFCTILELRKQYDGFAVGPTRKVAVYWL